MKTHSDFLDQDYTIETPENVSFGYEIAGIGSRFIAALIDTLLIVVVLLALNLIAAWLVARAGGSFDRVVGPGADLPGEWTAGLIVAAYTLLSFAVVWGYYIIFEIVWNGQTPGKRAAGIRVIGTAGNPAGPVEIVVRNLVRLVDFLPSAYAFGLVVMFLSEQSRRLGDYAAGTLVVKERKDVRLDSLTSPAEPESAPPEGSAPDDDLLQRFPTIRRLLRADLALIEDTLDRDAEGKLEDALVPRLAAAIAARLGQPAPDEARARDFLEDVSEAYQQVHSRRS